MCCTVTTDEVDHFIGNMRHLTSLFLTFGKCGPDRLTRLVTTNIKLLKTLTLVSCDDGPLSSNAGVYILCKLEKYHKGDGDYGSKWFRWGKGRHYIHFLFITQQANCKTGIKYCYIKPLKGNSSQKKFSSNERE